ncbi:uncharacterized protein [Bemisia tabaci]|uniref:uncharacterized protein n=1 Tax=Bemisia tabaci TaxID=7038 RepID=UPI003B28611D
MANPLFYEVQGLLNIMNRKKCILLVVSRKYVTPFTVKRDESFWRDEMLGKIVKFYEGTLAPKLSAEMLPRIRNLQVAANIAYGAISELDGEKALDIYRRTQDGSEAYDVLWDESRIRIMPQHYHLVMHPNIPTKEKVNQILKGYYTSREGWNWQQSSRKSFLNRYIDMHPEWTIKEDGGLIIDPAFPYLATFPTAYGYGSLQDQPQSPPKRQPSSPSKHQPSSPPKRKPLKRPSSRGHAILALEAPQPPEVPKNGFKSKSTSGSKVDVDEAGSSPPRTKTRLQVIYEVVAFIPSVADAYQLNDLYVDKGRTLLKRDSRSYYKVQGSMAISRVRRCLFILGKLGTKEKEILHSEVVDFDAKVWRKLQQKLAHFYFSTYLVYHANPEFFKSLARGKTLRDLIAEDPFPTAEEVEAIAKDAKDDEKEEDVHD